MQDRVVFDPNILGGKPVIKGTRVSVEFILQLLASGMDISAILEEYPRLEREDILAAIEYAAKTLVNEQIIIPLEMAA